MGFIMGKENFSKIKLLKIWEILKQESDENRPLTTGQIIERLADSGITCDRRTLYADIATLNSFGYEVVTQKGQHSNSYYIVDRRFDIPELRILIDAVQAASFISPKKTEELTDKIAALGGSYRADILKKNIVEFNTTKHSNEHIYYTVNKIEDAILAEKKIAFQYFDLNDRHERVFRKNGEKYTANPVAMIFSNDNYYLICYHDNHDNIVTYRIDRMLNAEMLADGINTKIRPKALSISKHRKQAFSMFGGEKQTVSFEADRDMLDVIFDKFGEDMSIASLGTDRISFSAEVQISPMFFGWCCSFGERLKVVGPNGVVLKMTELLNKMTKFYSEYNFYDNRIKKGDSDVSKD